MERSLGAAMYWLPIVCCLVRLSIRRAVFDNFNAVGLSFKTRRRCNCCKPPACVVIVYDNQLYSC